MSDATVMLAAIEAGDSKAMRIKDSTFSVEFFVKTAIAEPAEVPYHR